jgi:predicted DNA-binding WGR domain protein
MLKLYKRTDDQLHYWETWDLDEESFVIHWGVVGETGEHKEVKGENAEKTVQKETDKKINQGYVEFEEDEVSFLEIEYKIDGSGTKEDLEKLNRLEEHVNELLGWTGLGHVDGNSIGSGTMEIGCIVVDFIIAKKVIEEKLKDTEFADYSKIYQMDHEGL